MKVSICMPYHNRKALLYNTLKSIQRFESVNNCEFIIVDEASDDYNRLDDIHHRFPTLDIKTFRFDRRTGYCPVLIHNKSFAMATGETIIIQNPESFHVGNVVSHVINNIKPNVYIVYAQYSIPENDTARLLQDINTPITIVNRCADEYIGWYQHSIWRNACYNFCTAITREDLLDLGGFDERYKDGAAFGDDEFITRVRRKNMNIFIVDDPYTYHQYHHPFIMYAPSNEALFRNTTLHEMEYKVKNSFIQ